jgi:hypothetical protein
MREKKSLVEEAVIQMKNLEDVIAENAKGILASTMRGEISELVKESLKEAKHKPELGEQGDDEDEIDSELDIEEPEDDEEEDVELDIEEPGDEEEDEDDFDMTMDFDLGDSDDETMMQSDDETLDLTGLPMDQVMKVFIAARPEDEIVVQKDGGYVRLKDDEKEYLISMNESLEEMGGEFDEMYEEETEEGMYGGNKHNFKRRGGHKMGNMDGHYKDYETNEEMDEIVYEIEMDEEDMDMNMDMDTGEELYPSFSSDRKFMGMSKSMGDMETNDEDDEIVYEIEMDDDDDEFDPNEEDDDFSSMMESKMSIKPKGVGMGHPSKAKYPKTMKHGTTESAKGTTKKVESKEGKMSMRPVGKGMGKGPKFTYEEGDQMDSTKGMKDVTFSKKETKEAARTLGNGRRWGKPGLPKPKSAPRHLNLESEVRSLREKNEEYRKALNIFREKLTEVAVFNSNLAYATRLFTEHSTTKQEKINILRRFDSVESIKESKALYKTLKEDFSSNGQGKIVKESLENVIDRNPSTGSAVNLIESKTYENPQFMRMKDLMLKITK